ncbi:hypothetical protein BDBG_01406 [Blastomyces gilchristii SLH14081]|uniref:Uncharacterized protein n=1 Tax=Blastomyces gilchristii (strain SLH14081) TaxID=559298 RepID=A0A179UCN6_BLAGS|nr:uncharacterized protein BDBG_01406 [Blastomyces gilchristii SLH14081]OAT04927.1 hypothetical protein BDBG_01406 [Blastomyces gilchristii SLH14081]
MVQCTGWSHDRWGANEKKTSPACQHALTLRLARSATDADPLVCFIWRPFGGKIWFLHPTLPPPSRLRPITPPFQRNRANHQCPDSGRLISCISACTWNIILGSHSARQSNSPLLEAHSLKPMSIWK